jgi:hypothetical protein
VQRLKQFQMKRNDTMTHKYEEAHTSAENRNIKTTQLQLANI